MGRRGLTLVETLLAAGIGAVLLLLSAHVLHTARVAHERLQESSRGVAELRRAFEIVSRDMHSAVASPPDLEMTFGLSRVTVGTGQDLFQMATVVGDPLLTSGGAGETAIVEYTIEPDPESGRPALWRYETPYRLPESGSSSSQLHPDRRAMPLLRGVSGVAYLFYNELQQTWQESWEEEVGLPTAVRMDLALAGERPNQPDRPVRQESWTFTLPAAAAQTAELQAQAEQEAAAE